MAAPEHVSEEPSDLVQSLVRGLEVIRAFDADHPQLSLSEVARRTGISPAAASRFLRTLAALGYVRSDGRQFTLTPRVLELGYHYLSSLSLPEVVQPHLERLASTVNESVSVAVRDGADIVYVARAEMRRIMSVRITIGTRFPAVSTSMGRVLLAYDDRAGSHRSYPMTQLTPHTLTEPERVGAALNLVRGQGYALVDEELEVGLRSLAVPLRDRQGQVVAALNVSTSTSRVSLSDLTTVYLPALRETAAAIETELRLL